MLDLRLKLLVKIRIFTNLIIKLITIKFKFMHKKILLIMAMPNEALPIIEKLKFRPLKNILSPFLPAKIYKSSANTNKEIFLSVNDYCPRFNVPRVGTQAAAILAWESIKSIQPTLVINAGTAGGFRAMGAEIGDVFISKNPIKYHHRNFHPKNKNFHKYAVGLYPSLNLPTLAKKLNLKTGIISSSDSLISSKQENLQIIKNKTTVKEMEAAAIAEVAQLLNVNFVALKIITDIVDIRTCPQKQFDNNFHSATEKLAFAIENMIKFI